MIVPARGKYGYISAGRGLWEGTELHRRKCFPNLFGIERKSRGESDISFGTYVWYFWTGRYLIGCARSRLEGLYCGQYVGTELKAGMSDWIFLFIIATMSRNSG